MRLATLSLLALLTPSMAAAADDPVPLDSKIDQVTVYGGSAHVRRVTSSALDERGEATLAVRGLPRSLARESVRVSCEGAEVLGVEVRDRFQTAVPDERVQELRDQVRDLERQLSVLDDRRGVLIALGDHLLRLLRLEEGDHIEEIKDGRASAAAWAENFEFLGKRLTENREAQRELGWEMDALRDRIKDLRLELGKWESAGGVQLEDVVVDLVGAPNAPVALEVEYMVNGAGWAPAYDLRAAKDLSSVELVYRAQVWQSTGEDWPDVELLLSTSQPQMGAQGPDPIPQWISLYDPKTARRAAPAERELSKLGYSGGDEMRASEGMIAAAADEAPAAPPAFASVSAEGLSLRFKLARKETIESRQQPTNVLVGRADLGVKPEYHCVPALDTNVWLRGETTNTSEWVMLPGRAAVYFGADFIGHAQLPAVQIGEDFTLHLGADPGLTVERLKTKDLREEPGFLSSRETHTSAWTIRIKNAGAFATDAQGAATVFVREVLPRSKDDRLEVSLAEAKPQPSKDERWKKDREEKGVLTWVVQVPRLGETQILWRSKLSYPEGMQVMGTR